MQSDFLVQRFQNLDSKDLVLWDLGTKNGRRETGVRIVSYEKLAGKTTAVLAWLQTMSAHCILYIYIYIYIYMGAALSPPPAF